VVKALLRRRPWLAAVLWGAAIFTVSSLPDPDPGLPLFPGCDKILHFIEYSILGVGLRYWAGGARPLFLAGGVGFAAIDEFHQRYVPGREASLWDWVADLAGLGVGFLAIRHFKRRGNDG
jgi:VanZ family protein